MKATVRLPRVLADVANTELVYEVAGEILSTTLADLFQQEPGLRSHLLDEAGEIRRHVSMFVDGDQADLGTPVGDGAEIRVLQAVSGG